MEKLNIYKNTNYMLNDAFDQTVMNIHIQNKQNGYKTYIILNKYMNRNEIKENQKEFLFIFIYVFN